MISINPRLAFTTIRRAPSKDKLFTIGVIVVFDNHIFVKSNLHVIELDSILIIIYIIVLLLFDFHQW